MISDVTQGFLHARAVRAAATCLQALRKTHAVTPPEVLPFVWIVKSRSQRPEHPITAVGSIEPSKRAMTFYDELCILLDKCWMTIQKTTSPLRVIKAARIQCVLIDRRYIGSSAPPGSLAKWVCACQRPQKAAVRE
jgi:hypothetical protein